MRQLIRYIFFLLLTGLLLAGSAGNAHAQKKKSGGVKSKQSELQKLRKEIDRYEKRIKESEKRERSALQRLDDYDRQTSLLRSLVTRLTEDIAENQKEIAIAKLNLSTAENELKQLKRSYARTIVGMYKRGRTHDTELLLSSESVNEMFIRSKYLKAYSERQRVNANEIRRKKRAIELQKMLLESKLKEQRLAIQEKRSEDGLLSRKVKEHKRLLTKVRQDKQSYEKQLRRKQAAARKVERMIADLIERERKRLEAARKKTAPTASRGATAKAPPRKALTSTTFGKKRGKLPWPVTQGALLEVFGENRNAKGHVFINNGIDISVPVGSPVASVADGTVSMVTYIAGFGNLVIVDHSELFYTVYANLSQGSVRAKQKVNAGQKLGKTGEGVSGPMMHFELWYDRLKQNPLSWLKKR